MTEDQFEYDVDSELPDGDNSDESPREGLYWVRKNNHEILASGQSPCPEPDNSGVVLRRYFRDLDKAVVTWEGWPYPGGRHFVKVAKAAIGEAASLLGTEPLEYFFVEGSRQYIAVVMRNSNHAGRLWLTKSEVHSMVEVKDSKPFDVKGKTFFKIPLLVGSSKSEVEKKVCPVLFQTVPSSGICPCEHPRCPYSNVG